MFVMQKTPDFNPEFRANLPRQSHVLSHDFGFTATTAHLNPVFHTIVSPGDTVKLGFDFNLRTMPLEAAAFADLTCHTEYFFVPMQLLYQGFDAAFYNIDDIFSTRMGSSVRKDLPLLDFQSMVESLHAVRSNAVMTYPDTDIPVESYGQSAIRLFDLLGYNPIGIACEEPGDIPGLHFHNPNVFPYPLLAYNCIYQYCYRLDARERFDQYTFNADAEYDQTGARAFLPSESLIMKYRPLDNDYFTDVKVSPIVDVLNMNVKDELAPAQNWLTRNKVQTVYASSDAELDVIHSGAVGKVSGLNTDAPTGSTYNRPEAFVQTNFGFNSVDQYAANISYRPINGQDINTANIRAMFASEKLWSITGRAKKNYDDQTLAHFGFKVPHDPKHQVSQFGHDISKIHIGEVIATANTELSPLGEIAGKGYGSQAGQIHEFTAPCHGVIMVIFSVVAQHNYEAGQLRANMVVDCNDLYKPEYDHLGEQPLFGYETKYRLTNDSYIGTIVGWQYRYEQWKRRYNRSSGAFRNTTGSLKSWLPTYVPYGGSEITSDFASFNLANTETFKCFINLPTDVNQIFLAQYSGNWSSAFESEDTWSAIYDNDPFVVNSHVNCVLVSSMSDYSLPRLDA